MKKLFATIFLFLLFQNAFSQNCNLEFGYTYTGSSQRFIWDDYIFSCKGDSITIKVDLISGANYQWFLDGTEIKDAQRNDYVIKGIPGIYTIKVSKGNCIGSKAISVKYIDNISPFFFGNDIPNERILCSTNGQRNFFINSGVVGNKKYQWQKDGVDIEGARGDSYNVSEEGTYSARVVQGSCNSSTSPLKITKSNVLTANIRVFNTAYLKDTLKVCKGVPIFLSLELSNVSDLKLFKDNKPTNWKQGESVNESGIYHFEARKGDCAVKTKTLVLIFGDSMSPFKIEQTTDNLTLLYSPCVFNHVRIPHSTIIEMMLPSNEFTFEWKKNGVSHSIFSGNSTLLIQSPGVYSVIARRGTCQMESDVLDVQQIKPQLKKLDPFGSGNKIELCAGASKVIYGIPYMLNNFKGGLYKDGKLFSSRTSPSGFTYDLSIMESGKYYTIFTDNTCTQFSDTLEILFKGRKAVPITLDKSQCQNGIFNLSVPKEDGLIYAWKKDGKAIPNLNTANITVKESGSYSAVINQDYCSVASSEIVIGAKIIANSTTCEGETLQLNTRENTSYVWTGPNGFTSNLQNPSISKLSVVNQGMYFLKATDEKNCTYKDSVFIKTNPVPVFTVQVPGIICEGKSFTITAKTLNNASAFYTFYSPDNEVGGFFNEDTWTRNNATQQMSGLYKITAKDSRTQCSATATTQININSASDCPSITIGDLSKTKICYNAETNIPFTTSGVFAPNTIFTVNYIDYQGKLIPIATGTKSPIKIRMTSNYRIIITANDRSISSSPTNYLNPIYVNSPYITYTNRSACTGYSVALKVDTSAYYRYDKIQWRLNEKIIEGATSVNYAATQSGAYSVDVTQNGCIISTRERGEVIVTIGKLEKPYLFAETSLYACDGSAVDLASGNYPKEALLQWNLEGKPIEKMTTSTLKATKKGGYSLTVKQGTCDVTSDTSQVFIGDIIQNKITGFSKEGNFYNTSNPINLCKGTLLNLYYDYRPYAYKEYLYSIKYTQDSISRSQGYRVQWQKNGVDIDKSDSLAYKVQEEGLYRLKVSQGNCVAYSKPVQVKFTNKIKLQLSYYSNSAYSADDKNIFACSADSVRLYFYRNNSEQHYSYPTKVFNDNKVVKELSIQNTNFYAATSGNYWVTQTYPIKDSEEVCIATSDTLNVKIGGTKIESVIQNVTSCLDTIGVNSYYQANAKYRWKFNDVYIPKDTTSSIKIYQTGIYQWEVNTKTCQFVSKPFAVTLGKLEATLESPYKTIPCYGEVYTLYPQIKSYIYAYDSKTQKQIDPPTFQWKKDGVDFSKEEYLENIPKGTYSVTIKQKKCSVTTNPITIDNFKIPREVSPEDSTFICPNGGFMELESVSNPKYSYTWIKDNKTLTNQSKPSLKASETGIYQAQIESEGCATLTYPVKVYQDNKPPTAFISNSSENIPNDSTRIKIDLTSSAPWTIQLANNQSFTVNKTPFEFAVKPTQTTVYELVSVRNTCGNGTVSGKVEAKVIILGNEKIEGAKINIFPVPTQNNCQLTIEMISPEKLEWYLFTIDGKLLAKDEKSGFEQVLSQKIDLEPFPNGKYLLKIIVGKKVVTREIVKLN